MRYQRVHVESFGYDIPPNVITSDEIEERLAPFLETIRFPSGRLEQLTGIRERKAWEKSTSPSEKSFLSAQRALEKSGLNAEDLGCIIHCSVCRDAPDYASASVVHQKLGLSKEALCFDISNACIGFINGMVTIANMIELQQIKAGLIVATEVVNEILDYAIEDILTHKSRTYFMKTFTCLTGGSGSVAFVLTDRDVSKTQHRLLGHTARINSTHVELCRWFPNVGFPSHHKHQLFTDGEGILINGSELALETWKALKSELNWENKTVDKIYSHQIGLPHQKYLYKKLGLDWSKDFSTIETFGNIGSVSLPLTMSLGVDARHTVPGDKVALFGIGSGLNCCMLGLEW